MNKTANTINNKDNIFIIKFVPLGMLPFGIWNKYRAPYKIPTYNTLHKKLTPGVNKVSRNEENK